jgi:hypothetical protein
MIRAELERIRVTEGVEAMFRTQAAAYAEVERLWPVMSVRDIARELDTSVPFVQLAAEKAGLPSRAIAMTPGDPVNPRSPWKRRRA